jgi:hypothetical protein
MNTRSKSKDKLAKINSELLVNIDFDDASKEWHKNKKAIGNSQYKYICCVITNKNSKNKETICNKVCYKTLDKCWIHRNK